jgi:hypothetical protein
MAAVMRHILLGDRGVALPMAVVTMALLSALMLALGALAQTEPLIAVNHVGGTQARALAESGVEYALWALANPTSPGGVPSPLPGPWAGAPLDGRTFVPLAPGGFTVKVEADAWGDPHRRTITAVGWVPTNSVTDLRPKARRRVMLDVAAVPHLGRSTPCALCVRGALDLTGRVTIDGANTDPACGGDVKYGALSREAIALTGPVTLAGGGGGSVAHQPPAAFEGVALSAAAREALRTMAWRNGTYYGPGFPRGGTVSDGGATWSGRVVFDASHPLGDGVVFVDTTDGRDAGEGADATTLAEARIADGGLAGPFQGAIVVNGSLTLAMETTFRGLLYAVDTLHLRATGAARLEGLAVALHVRGATPTRVDASGGDLAISFDCRGAGGAGYVPRGFAPLLGTYRDVFD